VTEAWAAEVMNANGKMLGQGGCHRNCLSELFETMILICLQVSVAIHDLLRCVPRKNLRIQSSMTQTKFMTVLCHTVPSYSSNNKVLYQPFHRLSSIYEF
jgi:hypothetical protein